MDYFLQWLNPPQFMPHGHCWLWTPSLLWSFVISDSLIAASYFTIPLALITLIKKRDDLQFSWIIVLFSIFILACGATHFISIITIWQPIYRVDAMFKIITAIASSITAIMLWRLMSKALAMPTSEQLRTTVNKLEEEVKLRLKAELALQELNSKLEHLISERTEELRLTNLSLLAEINQRELSEEALLNQKQELEVTLESIGDAVISTNLQSEIKFMNPVAEKMTGWIKKDAIGLQILEVFRILNSNTRKLAPNPMDLVINYGITSGLANHTVLVSKNGTEYDIEDSAAPIKDRDGNITGVVLVFHDVTEAHAIAEKMTYLAEHDFLTGLPNRMLLNDRVNQAINIAIRAKNKIALMFLDFDHFKKINDTLGHEVGDKLLKQVSKNLNNVLRQTDTICRLGGDEFIVLLTEIVEDYAIAEIAEKLLLAVALDYQIDIHKLNITASIGISVYPTDGVTVDALTKNADSAMYHAKAAGRNSYKFYTEEMSTRVAAQIELEKDLQKALSNNEFVLYYQPKVSLKTGEIVGIEALIRWLRPQGGLIAPDLFIPVAEETGLIKLIGKWVLNEACKQNKKWQDAGLPIIPIAINVSTVELRQKGYKQEVSKALLQTGLSPECLELEVTESVAIEANFDVIEELYYLQNMGVRLSIDDFGTGYSSLSYSKRLPFNSIKIDKSFIRDIESDKNDQAIIIAIINMSRSLNLTVIAEGVEKKTQLDFLVKNNCNEVQGYYFSKPVTAIEFEKLLADGFSGI